MGFFILGDKMNNELIEYRQSQLTIPKCAVSKNKLEFDPSLTFDEWKEAGRFLKQVEGSVQFWIGDWLNFGKKKYEHGRYKIALNELGYELKTLENISYISESIESSRRREDLGFSHHSEVAPLLPEEQSQWLDKAEQDHLSVRELRTQIKEAKRPEPIPISDGKYQVIYADPPWQYSNTGFEQGAERYYPTMPTEDICNLPIQGLVTERSVLFLWATNAFLKEGIQVCEAWGFNYKTNFVWIKNAGPSIGWFVKSRHELLLIATKGDGVHPSEKLVSWFNADIRKHSQKPEIVYEIIERMYPGPYIELFARNERISWRSWGNEIR